MHETGNGWSPVINNVNIWICAPPSAVRRGPRKDNITSYLTFSRHHSRWPIPIPAELARRPLCASLLLVYDHPVVYPVLDCSCGFWTAAAPSPTPCRGWACPHQADERHPPIFTSPGGTHHTSPIVMGPSTTSSKPSMATRSGSRLAAAASQSREATPTAAKPGPVVVAKSNIEVKFHGGTVFTKLTNLQVDSVFKSDLTNIRSLITCSICDQLLYEPWTLSCGHTYCYSVSGPTCVRKIPGES
jgi:hypothetical protein